MNTLKNATVLAIDDDPDILALLEALLVDKCKKLILLDNAEIGLELACKEQPDLILLDVIISKRNGYEVCLELKADEQTRHIPVIFLSGLSRSSDKVHGFNVGGVDYISKPFAIEEVIARIESCLVTHKKIPQSAKSQSEKAIATLQLKSRELEILNLYISGYKRSEIAAKVNISENTVKWYVKRLFQKFEVDSRAALIEKAKS
jgi:DNA-binding NarL/FixJ family response regulator